MNVGHSLDQCKCDSKSNKYCICPNCGNRIDLRLDRCVPPNYPNKKNRVLHCSKGKLNCNCWVDSGRKEWEIGDRGRNGREER